MEEVKLHTGTRIKLKQYDERQLPAGFLARLREFAHQDTRIQAVYVFAVQPDDQPPQPSMAIALKSGLFDRRDEGFLQIVDEIQLMLPDELSLNLYRFGASDLLARYCVDSVEPVYLRSAAWVDKQRKRLAKASRSP